VLLANILFPTRALIYTRSKRSTYGIQSAKCLVSKIEYQEKLLTILQMHAGTAQACATKMDFTMNPSNRVTR